MRVVFDTNVLMTGFPDCEEFVNRLLDEFAKWDDPVFKIALDVEGKIVEEYKTKFYEMTARDPLKRRSNLGKLYEYLRRVSDGGSSKIVLVKSELADDDKDLLDEKGCGNPIEPSIFGIVSEKPEETYAYLANGLSLEVPRGYCSTVYNEIASRFLHKNQHTRELLKTLIEDGPPPDTWPVVKKILEAIKACGGQPLEGECHEFKGTIKENHGAVDTGVLNRPDVLGKLPKTVCSMLNKRGGYIFLGIDGEPNFKVTGFIKWDDSEDVVQRDIENTLVDNFQSFPALKVDVHIVKNIPPSVISAGRMLVAVHVRRKNQNEAFYRATGKKGKTEHKHAIWSRCCSRVWLEPD